MKKYAIAVALSATGTLFALPANSVTVSSDYVQQTANEISGELGRYSQPTVYLDQSACGGDDMAAACGPATIAVGSQFLQGQEDQYGNYTSKMIIAHEWGHTIQFTYNIQPEAPYMELQADCTGGSFVKYASAQLGYSDFLASAVSSARAAADYDIHGTPAQRDYYTRWGYANGVVKCFNNLPRV